MFLDKMTNILLDHGATIDKYMGDCIMAFWNAPLPCKNHAERAINAALKIEEASEEINERIKELGLPSIDIGIGINTGVCIVGNMGSKKRFDYSVIGDAVNLASRLEGATRNYDARILISSFTREQLWHAGLFDEFILLSEVDQITVKGKTEKITVYTPTKLL
jgi:adenylate cyclase